MNRLVVPDAAERARALDTTRSFLVQAPAGAGKTELLVRRYLALLARVEEPEQILAVTFTRKAAAEMQERVMRTLAPSAGTGAGTGTDEQLQALVAGVRRRDEERGWRLAAFPARLRISTIDALNAALARSSPLAAGAHALRPIAEDPQRLYRLAARASVRRLADDEGPADAVADLLRHLDNNPALAESLLATLLARRDQWLPLVGAGADPESVRQALERTLARIVEATLTKTAALIPPRLFEDFVETTQAAALNLHRELAGPLAPAAPLSARFAWWQFAATTWLTAKGEWRSRLDKNGGFPPEQKDLKAHAKALLADLEACHGLLPALAAVLRLPLPCYPPAQWRALRALLCLLPEAVAELKLVFADENATDYIEVAMEGRAALGGHPDGSPGDDDLPSDLALRLDWRLQHILLDEFQDTSQAQYALLNALTRGWSPGDGRTLFLVGDPMQSIYRFRQAEVGLFIDVRDHGLPGIPLEFLRLRANFRSVPALVAWANDTFPTIFPATDDVLGGAIAFAPSDAARTDDHGNQPAVSIHPGDWQHPEAEEATVLGIVQDCLRRWPGKTIGILVRGRAHAGRVVRALHGADIALSANDLVSLKESVLAHDLLAITRALVHVGDRLAWLAVLRAPWCGMTLADLAILAETDPGQSLWERIQAEQLQVAKGSSLLSADGGQALARLAPAFAAGLERLGRLPLRDVVEGVWMELGGPLVAGRELPLAERILAVIDQHDVGGDCPDTLALARTLDQTHGSLPDARACVQVMTIHKAKGLEFDTVILPGLGRGVRGDSRPALLWQPVLDGGAPESASHGEGRGSERAVLLAPVNPRGEEDDRLYELLWEMRGQREAAETDRVIYVAVTRARERLHLLGQLTPPRGARAPSSADAPAKGSLLARLWPVLGPAWPVPADHTGAPMADDDDPAAHWQQPPLRRLPGSWRPPAAPAGLALSADLPAPAARDLPVYDWAGAWTRHAGSVAHRLLQQFATEHGAGRSPDDSWSSRARMLLQREGVGLDVLDEAADRVAQVLEMALTDDRHAWLFGRQADEHNEWAITIATDGRFRQVIIDRAFVDADGIRWIIDYKTSSHEGGDREAFIRSEVQRHAPQLKLYREAVARLEQRETCTALYFPLLQHLQLVDAGGEPA